MANVKSRFNFIPSKRKNFRINKSLAKPMQMVYKSTKFSEKTQIMLYNYSTRFVDGS